MLQILPSIFSQEATSIRAANESPTAIDPLTASANALSNFDLSTFLETYAISWGMNIGFAILIYVIGKIVVKVLFLYCVHVHFCTFVCQSIVKDLFLSFFHDHHVHDCRSFVKLLSNSSFCHVFMFIFVKVLSHDCKSLVFSFSLFHFCQSFVKLL